MFAFPESSVVQDFLIAASLWVREDMARKKGIARIKSTPNGKSAYYTLILCLPLIPLSTGRSQNPHYWKSHAIQTFSLVIGE